MSDKLLGNIQEAIRQAVEQDKAITSLQSQLAVAVDAHKDMSRIFNANPCTNIYAMNNLMKINKDALAKIETMKEADGEQ